MAHRVTPIRRAPRPGREDGTSEIGRYAVRWTDENTGPHTAEVLAHSDQDVRDQLEPLIGSNDMVIRKVSG
jgi:hypothetical protein